MLAQAAGEAVVKEVGECRFGRLEAVDRGKHAGGCGQQFVERQIQVAFAQHADDAQGMAAQRERVAVAGRDLADAEHADQRFQLVGQRNDGADLAARQTVAGEARLVMILDGVGDIDGKAVMQRVVAAHDALQFGEFADHVGQQVGLGQQCGLFGMQGETFAAQLLANCLGNGADALHAFALGPQPIVIDDLGQPEDSRFERFLAVLVEEELGIGQARTNHALVAADHRARVGRADVADDEELVGQLAGGVQKREILLIGLHGQDEAFLGHGEEFGLELSNQHVRALDQGGDFIEQGVVVDRLAANLGGSGCELAGNLGAALGKGGDHGAVAEQLGGVFIGIGKNHGFDGRFEAVALRFATGFQAENGDRNNIGAVQGDQRMRRTDEIDAAPAIGQLITHDLGNRQGGERRFDGLLQSLAQRRALGQAVVEQDVGLAVVFAAQAGDSCGIGTQGCQLLEQCRCGIAGGIETDGDRHQLLHHRPVGGDDGDIGDVGSEAARRGVGSDGCGRRRQTGIFQRGCKGGGKRFTELLQRLRRQFLDEEFDEQILGSHLQAAFFSIWARTSAAHSFGAIGKPRRARESR